MIVLMWLCLILLPLITGSGVLTIVYRKRASYDITFSESGVMGVVACIGISEVVHVAGLFGNLPLKTCGRIWGITLLAVMLFCGVILSCLCRNKKERMPVFRKTVLERSGIPFLFISVLLFQMLFVFCMKSVMIPGDITIETVQSFLAENGIYRVMPLTGQVSESGMPLRYSVLCLPTIYAMLCQIFGVNVQLTVCHVVPVVLLLIMYLSFYHLSGVLFGANAYKKRYLFLFIVAVLLLFMDGGVASDGYAALHGGYLGTSVRNLILVPYTFAVTLERQWWKAVLCVLAEACIAWTFWGLGVCLAIFVGVFLITILDKKSTRMHNILQIFRKGNLG